MPIGIENDIHNKSKNINDRQLVIFKIAGEEFGVDINEVKEIIRWTDVTRIPNTDVFIKGVINLRGSIVVVNDLAMKLGLPSKEIDDDTRILVVEVGNNTVGMIVDSATEVLRLDAEKVKDAPSMITSGIDNNYIDGVGVLSEDRLLTLLDLSKVMESKDFERILAAQQIAEENIVKEPIKESAESVEEPERKEDTDVSVDKENQDDAKAEDDNQVKKELPKGTVEKKLKSDVEKETEKKKSTKKQKKKS